MPTKYQIAKAINKTAIAAKAAGQSVTVDYRLPSVYVDNGNDEHYFFQGEEADNLIEETRRSFYHLFCSVENIILWQSQGW